MDKYKLGCVARYLEELDAVQDAEQHAKRLLLKAWSKQAQAKHGTADATNADFIAQAIQDALYIHCLTHMHCRTYDTIIESALSTYNL